MWFQEELPHTQFCLRGCTQHAFDLHIPTEQIVLPIPFQSKVHSEYWYQLKMSWYQEKCRQHSFSHQIVQDTQSRSIASHMCISAWSVYPPHRTHRCIQFRVRLVFGTVHLVDTNSFWGGVSDAFFHTSRGRFWWHPIAVHPMRVESCPVADYGPAEKYWLTSHHRLIARSRRWAEMLICCCNGASLLEMDCGVTSMPI